MATATIGRRCCEEAAGVRPSWNDERVILREWTPNAPESRSERERRIRRRMGNWVIVSGRSLLVGAPVAVIVLWVVPISWSFASSGPSFWVPESAFLLAILWLLMLPAMLLPWTPEALFEVSEGKLTGVTVLGRRYVDLETARILLSVPVPSKYSSPVAHVIRDRRHWLIVEVEGFDDLSGAEPPETILAAAQKTRIRWYVYATAWVGALAWLFASIAGGLGLLWLAISAR